MVAFSEKFLVAEFSKVCKRITSFSTDSRFVFVRKGLFPYLQHKINLIAKYFHFDTFSTSTHGALSLYCQTEKDKIKLDFN